MFAMSLNYESMILSRIVFGAGGEALGIAQTGS